MERCSLESCEGLHPPKSKLGIAIRYALRHWVELSVRSAQTVYGAANLLLASGSS
jgi:hypothetical protein